MWQKVGCFSRTCIFAVDIVFSIEFHITKVSNSHELLLSSIFDGIQIFWELQTFAIIKGALMTTTKSNKKKRSSRIDSWPICVKWNDPLNVRNGKCWKHEAFVLPLGKSTSTSKQPFSYNFSVVNKLCWWNLLHSKLQQASPKWW